MGLDLITKAEYKAYMGISSTTADGEIDTLIPKVSEFTKTYCKRTFIDYYNDPKTEIFDGGFRDLILHETPVVNILSVQYSSDFGQTYTKLTKYTDWVQQGDAIRRINYSNLRAIFDEAINGYKVTYFGGYESVPADLKLAVMDLLTYYKDNEASIKSTKSPGTNTTQIEYIQSNTLPAHIKRVFDLYIVDYT